jgi:hypothetical protein
LVDALRRSRTVVVTAADKDAASRRCEFDAHSLEPFLGGGFQFLRDRAVTLNPI